MAESRTSERIREAFMAFFKEKGHEIVPSDSIVPRNDPTLMFTNAGMNQFKDVFLGTGDRPYRRAADTQKCLRVSGKHNDLDEVGHDTYHHTFFEMLGNWSFGDYFKREAIRWAWELLVDRWGLTPDRLYATVHNGDAARGLEADEEAARLWREETSIPPDHVLYFDSKDNFWMMGDTGPCGPCSEIHIDLRPDDERARVPGHTLVNADDPRVIEIWNLVFIQYNALSDGSLEPLASKHVDTGMGFERVVAVLQGKQSNYDTDLFAPILQRIADLAQVKGLKGYDAIEGVEAGERERIRIAMRVIADHIRACAFTIADGVYPGNVGPGYVIRRILRRAVRYGYQTLGFREPFLYRLVEPLVEKMGATFDGLMRQQAYIERVIRAEEESFLETLGTGLVFFERLMPYVKALSAGGEPDGRRVVLDRLGKDRNTLDLLEKAYVDADREALLERFAASAGRHRLPGEVAFLLHDTYGFPVDLTALIAREEGLSVDMERYEALMKEQKDRAREATSKKQAISVTGHIVSGPDIIQGRVEVVNNWDVVTEGPDSTFLGYDRLRVEGAAVRAVRTVPGRDGDVQVQMVLDRTPFYAESGGQVGDTGVLQIGDETVRVLDTQKEAGRIVHVVDRLPEVLDAPVVAEVDGTRRMDIARHHSATHLLHAALRERLGRHVAQKGSLVAPDRLRFDFSHFERVGPDELRDIERRVNERIMANVSREIEADLPLDEALARGAMALFGEKYGDTVRVVSFDPAYSMELCGGTHVGASGEIGPFRIVSEGSVAAGMRRVEAVAGTYALDYIDRELAELERVRGSFKALQQPVSDEVAALIEQQKALEKELEALKQHQLEARLDAFIGGAREVGAVRVVTGRLERVEMDALRTLGETLRDRLGSNAVSVLGGVAPEGDKVYLVASVADDLIATTNLKAGALVGALAKKVGGGGGGRPTLATAGGRKPEALDETLDQAAAVVADMLA